MANSMAPWTPETRIEPVLQSPIVDPATGFEYRVLEVDGRLVQEERQLDASGLEVARLVRPMDWVVGSGDAARTYFGKRGDGLTQLPLTWYTQEGGRWDWSPGYEGGANPPVLEDDARRVHVVPQRRARARPSASRWRVRERPPRASGASGATGRARPTSRPGSPTTSALEGPDPTIVNARWLDLDLRLDACSQCHLHASVDVLRQGETAYSYRPGRPALEPPCPVRRPGRPPRTTASRSSRTRPRMQASACFQESLGAPAPLECTTCHDPHRGFEARPAGAQSAACVTCHDAGLEDAVPRDLRAEHALEVGCVGCHMPRVEASTAPHSSFTDHWVRVVDGPVRAVRPALGRSGVVAPARGRRPRRRRGAGLYEGVAAITHGSRASDPAGAGPGRAVRPDRPRAGRPARALPPTPGSCSAWPC